MPPIAWATPSPRCASRLVASHRERERAGARVVGERGELSVLQWLGQVVGRFLTTVRPERESRPRLIDRLKGGSTGASGRAVIFGR